MAVCGDICRVDGAESDGAGYRQGTHGKLGGAALESLLGRAVVEDLWDGIRIRGASLLRQGDRVDIWVDPETHQFIGMTFTTTVDATKVSGTVEYNTLKDGLSYPARTVITVAEEEMEAVIENSEYEKKGD
jgi:hypothetical protein